MEFMKDYLSNSNFLREIYKEFDSEKQLVKFLKFLMPLDKILYFCIVLSIASIYSYTTLNDLPFSHLFFILALTLVFHIITAWAFIFQDEYKIKSKRVNIVSKDFLSKIKKKNMKNK